jgi:uncharacterized protein YjiK
MSRKLELIHEQKLYRLLSSRKENSRLEASGVALLDNATALIIFDNLNLVARIDLSLKRNKNNQFFPAPSLGLGFEDIAIDQKRGRVLCLIESLEDIDGQLRSFVAEYDAAGHFLGCNRLETRFEKENKGFEGLTHIWLKGREHLYALCEANFGASAKAGGGRVEVFTRAPDGGWKASHQLRLPKQVEFEDHSALAYQGGQIAVVSQESARLWVARIDQQGRSVVPDSDAIYRFPSKSYGNVEGIAWLSKDTLVAVSDRKKRDQPDRCAEKDQSIHIFRIPPA